jgi:hypothetical protein
VLLTTFSRNLAARSVQYADLLLDANAPERQQLEIAHLHRVAFNIWSMRTGQQLAILVPKELMTLLEATTGLKGMVQFPLNFLRAEWETIIDPNAIKSAPGRAWHPLGAKQRLALWHVFAYVLDAMQTQGLLTWNRSGAARLRDWLAIPQ